MSAMAGSDIAAEAHGLVKDFDGKRAVDGVSLTVPAGSITGILGPNGAGKTTTLRMLLGIIDPSSGSRSLLGRARPIEAAHEVGYLPEERGLYPAMPALEAIAFMGALRGLPLAEGRKRGRAMMEAHGLGHALDRQIRQLSKGMAQTVQLLGTLVHEPRLVILDEPSIGLAPNLVDRVMASIRHVNQAFGATIPMIEKKVRYSLPIADRVAVLKTGRKIYDGPPDPLHDRVELMKLF